MSMVSLPPASRGSAPEWLWNSRVNGLLEPFRQMVVLGEVEEAGELALETHLHGAGRPVALLGNDDLGLAAGLVHLVFPLRVFERAGLRLPVLEIIFLAEDEQNHVRVLL